MTTQQKLRHVAILDIGKTNAKTVILDASSGEEIAVRRIANHVLQDSLYPHYDIEMLWQFFLESLSNFAAHPGFDAISITTHGAAAVLLDKFGNLALPVLDYEMEYPADIITAYAELKPPFAETGSPLLARGLNLGAQLHYLKLTFPYDFTNTHTILTYPQYWAWRLTGIAAVEVTSLGCHTDLGQPEMGDYSTLVDALGIREKLPPLRSAFDTLGAVQDDIAQVLGLTKPVPVYCGIHDSNASLLGHLMESEAPFAVVSTGTWVVSFAVGGDSAALDAKRDTLINVDAFGRPVPSARYMGGREFNLMTDGLATPSDENVNALLFEVLTKNIMALPSAVPGCGPFPDTSLRWTNADTASDSERYGVACLYAALMTDTCLGLLGSHGPIHIEGPFSTNLFYLKALAGFTGREVIALPGATGTSLGAGILTGVKSPQGKGQSFTSDQLLQYDRYRRHWVLLSSD